MDSLPIDILKDIFTYCKNGHDFVNVLKVSKQWSHIMKEVLEKPEFPSFEDCILDSDYYHFRKYLSITPTDYQKQFINLVGNTVFIRYFNVNVTINLNKLLTECSKIGFLRVVQYLVDKGADIHADDNFALRGSAANGHLKVVKYLIEKCADIHANDDRALRLGARYGHLEVVKFLVEKGADIHAYNDYALKLSAENGHLEVVKYLVEKGANINVLPKELRDKYELN